MFSVRIVIIHLFHQVETVCCIMKLECYNVTVDSSGIFNVIFNECETSFYLLLLLCLMMYLRHFFRDANILKY